ncbi:MAG: NUDIX hydrolase [Phycisphaerae bacterium]|nr:NUDIX hydrolase [Phycisphaerae bacterium]
MRRLLFDGALARLDRATFSDGAAEIALGPTSYRDFLGTNLRRADEIAGQSPPYLSNPLGVSILPITSDGYVALGMRSDRVVQHAGMAHPFGGMVEPWEGEPQVSTCADLHDTLPAATAPGVPSQAESSPHACPDIFAAAVRELVEETGLREDEISPPVLIGLVRDLSILQPEAVFETHTRLCRTEFEARFSRHDDKEHASAIFFRRSALPASASAVPHLLADLPLTPIAQAAIRLLSELRD